MNIWNAFPFVRYSLALIIGIIGYSVYPDAWAYPLLILPAIIVLVLLSVFSIRKAHLNLFRVMSGFFTLFLIAFIGGYLVRLHDQSLRTDHYLNMKGEVEAFSGIINSDHYEREQYFRYELKLNELITDSVTQNVSGSIYLYVKKDSTSIPLAYGTKLFVNGTFYKIEAPKNPDEFDYQRYLAHKNIFAQAFVSENEIANQGSGSSNGVLAIAYQVRSYSSQMISDFIPGTQEAAVLNALQIGVKDYLDNEIKDAYSSAGAMHVLAVSGLHVGIVYLLVSIIFGTFKKTTWGRIVFLLVSLAIIWCYALITGFSPSVMRAATMFSVIIIGETSKRTVNIYNSLGLAAFILILYNPFFIYEVGFQLSFIAVFGIVMFQPPIYRLWEPKNKVLDYLWAIISVSIAAQLVTFPLSVYYFNQFPTYFLISNLIVIPASMVMLTTGLFMLGIGSISTMAGETIGFLLGSFVKLVNWLILLIQELPLPTVEWLYFSSISVLLLYLFMLYFFQAIRNYQYPALIFSIVCLGLLFVNFYYEEFRKVSQQRIIVYQTDKQAAIDLIDGSGARLVFTGTQEELVEQVDYRIHPHRLASGLEPVSISIEGTNFRQNHGLYFLTWKGLKILIVGTRCNSELNAPLDVDLLILLKNEKQFVDKLKPRFLIVGSIEPWWERSQMIDYLKENELVFYDLEHDGYFELDLNHYAESAQPSIFVK